jgi:hypothetical protein
VRATHPSKRHTHRSEGGTNGQCTDPRSAGDHLITRQNAAHVLIDYQPSQIRTVRSMDSLACELQRDWNRLETMPEIVEIVLTKRLLKE